ncbi:MAG: hypothetical protein M3261_03510 [Thermoproteota archaeon]|nr:hypothetical protein [Thermoproteota archaeon]
MTQIKADRHDSGKSLEAQVGETGVIELLGIHLQDICDSQHTSRKGMVRVSNYSYKSLTIQNIGRKGMRTFNLDVLSSGDAKLRLRPAVIGNRKCKNRKL